MVLLEAFGFATQEVFDYNRENYSFDNEQRLDKEKTRLTMQVERFNLFREDIEDLVDLTVSKMDMYHAVAALLLGSAATLYTEGRMHVPGNTPPWYVGIYFTSIAGTFCYLLLAVWLSMYASVCSHAFGVRLRTRFVRLPIPSLADLQALTAKLQDFEKQGVTNVLRVPFAAGPPQWKLEKEAEEARLRAAGAAGPSSSSASGPGVGGPSTAATNAASEINKKAASAVHDWLGSGEAAFGKHAVVDQSAAAPGQHVQLFRCLQARWQCYDAYARVSMSIGINQLLQTLTYYLLGCTLIENMSPSTAIGLALIYQAAAVFILYIDVAGVSRGFIAGVQLVGTIPATMVLIALMRADREETMLLSNENKYPLVPISFFIELVWFEALLWIASPNADDEAALPRRFRSVLFLDVFGDAYYDPTEAEQVMPAQKMHIKTRLRRQKQESDAAECERLVLAALSALRRWEAIPSNHISQEQREIMRAGRREFEIWRRAYIGHLVQQKSARGVAAYDLGMMEEDAARAWEDLTRDEQASDPFADFVMGPFRYAGRTYYWDLEGRKKVHDISAREKLTTKDLEHLVKEAQQAVQHMLVGAAIDESELEGDEDSDEEEEEQQPSQPQGKPNKRTWPTLQRENTGGTSGLPSKVERLPWKALRSLTRCFQVCWLFLGIMDVFFVLGFDFDRVRWIQKDIVAGRRLMGSDPAIRADPLLHSLYFRKASVEWTHGRFFRPSGLTWMSAYSSSPSVSDDTPASEGHAILRRSKEQEGQLIVSSPYLSYSVPDVQAETVGMSTLPKSELPPNSVLFCPPTKPSKGAGAFFQSWPAFGSSASSSATTAEDTTETTAAKAATAAAANSSASHTSASAASAAFDEEMPSCLAAALVGGQLKVWSPNGATKDEMSLDFNSTSFSFEAWSVLAGSLQRCSSVPEALREESQQQQQHKEEDAKASSWCLLLAGKSGDQLLLASLGLRRTAPGIWLPIPGQAIRPRLEVPLASTSCVTDRSVCEVADRSIAALHMDVNSGRLWAAYGVGEVEAWDILRLRRLGRFLPQWPEPSGNWDIDAPTRPRYSRIERIRSATALDKVTARKVAVKGICEVPGTQRLVLAGLDESGPALFIARLPNRVSQNLPDVGEESIGGFGESSSFDSA
eukprot:CAMPEP_0206526716 /NCGR_PEP_ID=MMETSP0325_2-20121206/913_1 /ASSEMBLY_ACC=CAM_ASM_000347 /TAXON_ID=2866 /ORGANISM="Crypthecodinium cohnii, Strain Seligo" /LENGTH=1143 /DNA_ID=CAMNT_0054021977 /DNA_START=336 /DNA_END=3764 /DNA_ORIENTATION=+